MNAMARRSGTKNRILAHHHHHRQPLNSVGEVFREKRGLGSEEASGMVTFPKVAQ